MYEGSLSESCLFFRLLEGAEGSFACQAKNLAGIGDRCTVKVGVVIYSDDGMIIKDRFDKSRICSDDKCHVSTFNLTRLSLYPIDTALS